MYLSTLYIHTFIILAFSQKHELYSNHNNHDNQLTGDGCPRAFDVLQYLNDLEILLIL